LEKWDKQASAGVYGSKNGDELPKAQRHLFCGGGMEQISLCDHF